MEGKVIQIDDNFFDQGRDADRWLGDDTQSMTMDYSGRRRAFAASSELLLLRASRRNKPQSNANA